jgi:uncharacterized protein YjbI with pentapeptide repeats
VSEFVGEDLSGARFEEVDFSGAWFHNVYFRGTVVRGAWLEDVEIESSLFVKHFFGLAWWSKATGDESACRWS